jgi:hypothetical protein
MRLFFVVATVLLALLFAASGVAGITRGWVLPMNRGRVRRVRLYGWGQLVAAFGLCLQGVFGWVISNPGIRPLGTLFGSGLLLTGVITMGISQRAAGDRQASGMP